MQFQQDLSSIPLQCIQTIAQEQGWGEHFQMFAVFLSTLTLPLHHYLLECRKGLLPVFLLDFKQIGQSVYKHYKLQSRSYFLEKEMKCLTRVLFWELDGFQSKNEKTKAHNTWRGLRWL